MAKSRGGGNSGPGGVPKRKKNFVPHRFRTRNKKNNNNSKWMEKIFFSNQIMPSKASRNAVLPDQ